eukprot:scaffold248986_cov119-Cyclotella_meneghiniana.AAC.1
MRNQNKQCNVHAAEKTEKPTKKKQQRKPNKRRKNEPLLSINANVKPSNKLRLHAYHNHPIHHRTTSPKMRRTTNLHTPAS